MKQEDNEEKAKELANELYKIRVVVLIENAPQSNTYNQFLFTPEHFKAVSKAIAEGFKRDSTHTCGNPDCPGTTIEVSDREIKLPDNINDIHYCVGECKC